MEDTTLAIQNTTFVYGHTHALISVHRSRHTHRRACVGNGDFECGKTEMKNVRMSFVEAWLLEWSCLYISLLQVMCKRHGVKANTIPYIIFPCTTLVSSCTCAFTGWEKTCIHTQSERIMHGSTHTQTQISTLAHSTPDLHIKKITQNVGNTSYCAHACTLVYTFHTCTHNICAQLCIHVCTYCHIMHKCKHTHIHTHTQTLACTPTRTHVYMYTCTHRPSHTYTHTQAHTYTQTQRCIFW